MSSERSGSDALDTFVWAAILDKLQGPASPGGQHMPGASCKITVTAVHFVTVRIVLIYFRLHIRDSESNYITCHLSVSGWLQLKSAVSSNGC